LEAITNLTIASAAANQYISRESCDVGTQLKDIFVGFSGTGQPYSIEGRFALAPRPTFLPLFPRCSVVCSNYSGECLPCVFKGIMPSSVGSLPHPRKLGRQDRDLDFSLSAPENPAFLHDTRPG